MQASGRLGIAPVNPSNKVFWVALREYIPKLVLVLVFLWIGSPIASHMVGRLEISTDDAVPKFMKREDAAAESADYRVDDWENSEADAWQGEGSAPDSRDGKEEA